MSSSSIGLNYPAFIQSEQQKKSRLFAGLLLTVVVLLHTMLIFYFLHAPKTELKDTPVVVELMMLPAPGSMQKQAAKEPPPAPQKKEPIKPKPVVKPPKPVKKQVVVKKTAPAPKPPQPEEIKEAVPAPEFEPAPPVAAPVPAAALPAASNSRVTATPEKTAKQVQDQSKTIVSGVVPLLRVPPKYPARAASRQIEGWVKVEFTIQTDGTVDDAVVVASEPETIFDDAALTAISKWKFKEKIVNGVAVPQRALQKLQFKLEQ